LFFSKTTTPVLCTNLAPIQWVPWVFFQGVKEPKREYDFSSQCLGQEWMKLHLHSPKSFHGVHEDNFNLVSSD
jgi:hypothetical protein